MSDDLFGQLVSPEVHADRSVSFRFRAPHAQQIFVKGIMGDENVPMTMRDDGVWHVRMGPLPPEVYSYKFEVDGADCIDPQNRNVKQWLSIESVVLVPGSPPLLHEQQLVPHGSIHQHTYLSQAAETERQVLVYTPPGYDPNDATPIPCLYLLHGFGDDQTAWLEVGRMNWILDNLIAKREVEPMMVVMPNGHPAAIGESQDFDEYAERNIPVMQQDLMHDLQNSLTGYHAATSPDQRAVAGLSMGGGQSISIGLWNPDSFGWVGAFSAATPIAELDQRFPRLVEGLRDGQAKQQTQKIWIACGEDDFLLPRNKTFVQWLKKRNVAHDFAVTEGGHDWSVWRKYLAEFLRLLFK